MAKGYVSVCVICGSPDNDKKTDCLRESYLTNQKKFDPGMYSPRLEFDDLYKLQKGFNTICNNRKKCADRRTEKAKLEKDGFQK